MFCNATLLKEKVGYTWLESLLEQSFLKIQENLILTKQDHTQTDACTVHTFSTSCQIKQQDKAAHNRKHQINLIMSTDQLQKTLNLPKVSVCQFKSV